MEVKVTKGRKTGNLSNDDLGRKVNRDGTVKEGHVTRMTEKIIRA